MAGKRGANISYAERRQWLQRYENGGSVSAIAKAARRSSRTVPIHLERARRERELEAARQDQLRDALRSHQGDLRLLIELAYGAIKIGPFSRPDGGIIMSEGIADLESAPAASNRIATSFGPDLSSRLPESPEAHLVAPIAQYFSKGPFELTYDPAGARVLRLRVEGSPAWRMLREHRKGDGIWKELATWGDSALGELEAIWTLNKQIRTNGESELGANVRDRSVPGMARLTTAFVRQLRAELLGESQFDLIDEMRWDGMSLVTHSGSSIVADAEPERQPDLDVKLRSLVNALRESRLVQDALDCRRRGETQTRTVLSALDRMLLLNFVPGECSVCRSLDVP